MWEKFVALCDRYIFWIFCLNLLILWLIWNKG